MRRRRKREHRDEAKAQAKLRRQERERERAQGAPPELAGERTKARRGYQPVTLYRLSNFLKASGLLEDIVDTRAQHLVRFGASTLVAVMMFGLLTAQTAMRGIETLTKQLSDAVRANIGLKQQRVSDTALYDFLKLLEPSDIGDVLVRFAKAMWSMGKLRPQGLPFSVVAFDGKNTLTLTFSAAIKALNKAREERAASAVPEELCGRPRIYKKQLKGFFAESLPMVQLVFPKSKARPPYALVRSHRMTLVSSNAAVTLFNEFIPGSTNEVGHAPGFLTRALAPYRSTTIAKMVTADAGNCSQKIATTIRAMGSHYMLAVKKTQQEALREAQRLLGTEEDELREPDHVVTEWANVGKDNQQLRCRRQTWVTNANGLLAKFPSALQLVRVRRTVHLDDGRILVGNRYFVASMSTSELSAQHASEVIRMYWRCENGGHWASDLIWHEDTSRSPLTRTPQLLEVVTTLRLLAQSIVSVLRAMTRRGYDEATPISWKEVIENIRRALWGAVRVRATAEVLVGD